MIELVRAGGICFALACFALVLLPILLLPAQASQDTDRTVLLVELHGYVGPATAIQVEEAIGLARSDGSITAIILTLDTFGGSADAMFRIVEAMQTSPVPIIGYVYPSGRQALSAGTFILMASDLAVMAPFTTIGSAQPVMGTEPTTEPKILNAFREKMASYAEIHGRNSTQATRFVTHNDNLQPESALTLGVIEVIAESPEKLVLAVDGMSVRTLRGTVTLNTAGALIVGADDSIRVRIMEVLSEPVVSSLLVSMGSLIVILGLTAPGYGAEVAGVIAVLLGLLGMGFDINITALALIALGVGLLVAEIHSPGFGVMGVGGILALALGLALNVARPFEPMPIAPTYLLETLRIAFASLAGVGAIFGFIIYKGIKATRMKRLLVKSQDPQSLLGSLGVVKRSIGVGEPGVVLVASDLWTAFADEAIPEYTQVRVVGAEGLKLKVAKVEEVQV